MLWLLCLCWHLWSILLYIFYISSFTSGGISVRYFYKLQQTNIKVAEEDFGKLNTIENHKSKKLMTLFPTSNQLTLFSYLKNHPISLFIPAIHRWISNGGGQKLVVFCDKKFSREDFEVNQGMKQHHLRHTKL